METGTTDNEQSNGAGIVTIQKNDEIKKIYTELFNDYVLSEREVKKLVREDHAAHEVKHPHHFYFLDFVPDNELNELFGVNLLTFSNNEKELETYKKDLGAGKKFDTSETIRPVPVKKKKKDLFDSPKEFALDYDFDIESGETKDVTLQLFNRKIPLKPLVFASSRDFLPRLEADNILITPKSSDNSIKTAYMFINRIHTRILKIFKYVLSMKNDKLEMTNALNKIYINSLLGFEESSSNDSEIKNWDELVEILKAIDKDPATDEDLKKLHKQYNTLTKVDLKNLLEKEDFKSKYKDLIKSANKDKNKEDQAILKAIEKIQKRKSPGPNKSYNDVIRFKQLQHEIFITMNYVGKHIEWLKDAVFTDSGASEEEKEFFIDYCETIQQQLEFLLKTIENPADMKKLEIRLINTKVEYFNQLNLPFVSHVTFQIYNPAITAKKRQAATNKLNSGFSSSQNEISAFSDAEKRSVRDKYKSATKMLEIIKAGKNSDLAKDNKNRIAYNSITSKDIKIAQEIFKLEDLAGIEGEKKNEELNKEYEDKVVQESGATDPQSALELNKKLNNFTNLNLTFELETPILPFYAIVGHISLPKKEQNNPQPTEDTSNPIKWESQINKDGKNVGAITTRKYVVYKHEDKSGFKPIIEPIKQKGQKIESKNRFFSKLSSESEDNDKTDDKTDDKLEDYLKEPSTNRIEESTKDGKILTFIDRNEFNYEPESGKKVSLLKSMQSGLMSGFQIAAENVSGTLSTYNTFHNRLFKSMIEEKDNIDFFADKLVPDKTTTGRICFKKDKGSQPEKPITNIVSFNFCAFIRGLEHDYILGSDTDNDDKLEKALEKAIEENAISLYELENCIDPLGIESMTQEERITNKNECWKKHNTLDIYTFGHFSRLPYTSRNILQQYAKKEKAEQIGGAKKKKIDVAILDLFTAWYNIVPWIGGTSATIAGGTSGSSRLPRIPYHIDEEFSDSRDGNIRVYNFLNDQLYVFYRDEFYKAYWLRRDINFNNNHLDRDLKDCRKDEAPLRCPTTEQGGGGIDPKPIRPKISYGETKTLEFKDKQKGPPEESGIIEYEDSNIDLIPKIILRRDTVKGFKEMDASNYKYKAEQVISKYLKDISKDGYYDSGKQNEDFATQFVNFLHVIGIKKINYNVYNNKEGNIECNREDEKDQFSGKTAIGRKISDAAGNIIDTTAEGVKGVVEVAKGMISPKESNKMKLEKMKDESEKTFIRLKKKYDENHKQATTGLSTNTISSVTHETSPANIDNKKTVEQMVNGGKKKFNELKGFSNLINQSKTTFEKIRTEQTSTSNQMTGGNKDNELCIRYDHTDVRTAMFASKWMNKGYSLDFIEQKDEGEEEDPSKIDPYAIETVTKDRNKYYQKGFTNAVDIIVTKDDMTTEIVYNLKYKEVDSNKEKISDASGVVGTFLERITHHSLVENKNNEVEKVLKIFKTHIEGSAGDNVNEIESNAQVGTMYKLIEELAQKVKLEDFLIEPEYDFMQSIERLMFRVENNPIKVSMLKALGLDFKAKERKSAEEKKQMLQELKDREKAARALKNSMLLIAAYLVSNKLYTENIENQINAMIFNVKANMDVLKFQNDGTLPPPDDVDTTPQQGGYNYRKKAIPVSKLLDDVSSLEKVLNISNNNSNKKGSRKQHVGGGSVNTISEFKSLVKLIYDCDNLKTSNSKKKSIQDFIDKRYPKDKLIEGSDLAKMYKECQPQEGGAIGLGNINENVKSAKTDIINSVKALGIENLITNPYFIPHHLDPYIEDHHFSFIQPCPEGRGATICSLFAALAGRSTMGGGSKKGNLERFGEGVNKRLGIGKKAKTAAKRFGAVFKSPEGSTRVTAGVKNTRNALLNNGVVRAIKDRSINPNNVPYIMNEGKLKNYLQLMQWYFMGDMFLDDEQISDNMTVRSGRVWKKKGNTGKEIRYSDDLKRESTGITLDINPSIERRAYMPKIVNNRRLIANSNNVVLGNKSENHLTDPGYNKIHRGNYGKLAPRKGDDLALAFWLGFR